MTKPALQKSTRGGFLLDLMKNSTLRFSVLRSQLPIARELLWGRSVTTIQAVIFGMMLSWTPSAVLLAILLWSDPRDPVDQP
jgi:hypothetical protein